MTSIIDKEDVFHGVVHDLKSPLAAIFGLSDIFLKVMAANLSDKQKEVIGKIKDHSQFALELVGDILDVENITSGKIIINRHNVSLKVFIETLIQTHLMAATEKGISVDIAIPQELNVPIDEKRMKQVLNNLLSNAVKFSNSGSKIEVSAYAEDEYYYIKIKDQGPGIKDEEIARLYKPFAQLSNQPTANEKSTGLGLSIVKNLVEILGGVVNVESLVGYGTTFTLKFPKVALAVEEA